MKNSRNFFSRIKSIALHIYNIYNNFCNNDGFLLAGAVSFSALSSSLPLTLLFLWLLGKIIGDTTDKIDMILNLTNIESLFPAAFNEINIFLETLANNKGVMGYTGLVLIAFFGAAIFLTLESSINRIFGARGNRRIFRRLAVSMTTMIFSFFMLLGSMFATILATIISDLNIRILGINPLDTGLFWRTFFAIGPPLMIFLFLIVIYRFVPARKVCKRSSLIAALSASVFWEFARRAFGWYISNFATYNKLYGALGAFVAIFIWLYYSSVIFLIGAQMANYIEMNFFSPQHETCVIDSNTSAEQLAE